MPCNKCCATSDYSRSGPYGTNEKRKKIEDLIDRENFKKEKKMIRSFAYFLNHK